MTETDNGFLIIRRRMKFALIPLAELWEVLSEKNTAEAYHRGFVRDNQMLKYVEQYVVLCAYGRRPPSVEFQQQVLSRFVKKPKWCKDILKPKDRLFNAGRFG